MLNSLGESCYEGVKLLAALVGAARSTSVPDVCAVADTVSYEGARGLLHLHDHHLDQPVYLLGGGRTRSTSWPSWSRRHGGTV